MSKLSIFLVAIICSIGCFFIGCNGGDKGSADVKSIFSPTADREPFAKVPPVSIVIRLDEIIAEADSLGDLDSQKYHKYKAVAPKVLVVALLKNAPYPVAMLECGDGGTQFAMQTISGSEYFKGSFQPDGSFLYDPPSTGSDGLEAPPQFQIIREGNHLLLAPKSIFSNVSATDFIAKMALCIERSTVVYKQNYPITIAIRTGLTAPLVGDDSPPSVPEASSDLNTMILDLDLASFFNPMFKGFLPPYDISQFDLAIDEGASDDLQLFISEITFKNTALAKAAFANVKPSQDKAEKAESQKVQTLGEKFWATIFEVKSLAQKTSLKGNNLRVEVTLTEENIPDLLAGIKTACSELSSDLSLTTDWRLLSIEPRKEIFQTRTEKPPAIDLNFDLSQKAPVILDHLQSSLALGHRWSDSQSIEISMLDLPNLSLCIIDLQLVSTESESGIKIVKPSLIKNGTTWENPMPNIRLDLEEGEPVSHTLNFKATAGVPKSVTKFSFRTSDPSGYSQEKNGMVAKVHLLEGDAVDISLHGAEKLLVVPRNLAGKVIARHSGIRSENNYSCNHHGFVHQVDVFAVKRLEKAERTFSVKTADLEFPKERTASIRYRGPNQGNQFVMYRELPAADFDRLTPVWKPASHPNIRPRLAIDLPPGDQPVSMQYSIERVCWVGEDGPLAYSSVQDRTEDGISYTPTPQNTENESQPLALIGVFGELRLKSPGGLQMLTVTNPGHTNRFTYQLPNTSPSRNITAVFDRNYAVVYLPFAKLSQRVLDGRGRPLGSALFTGGFSDMYWGIPHTIETLTYNRWQERLIPFEIVIDPTKKALFEKNMAIHKRSDELAGELKQIFQAVDSVRGTTGRYGDDIAGAHYLYLTSRTGTNLRTKVEAYHPTRIAKEIAHADPAGAARFGYEPKPYKGYHISILKHKLNEEDVPKEVEHQGEATFFWEKGEFQSKAYRRVAGLIATPTDPRLPTFYQLNGYTLRFRYLHGTKVDFSQVEFWENWIDNN